jgi:hypothetical protein
MYVLVEAFWFHIALQMTNFLLLLDRLQSEYLAHVSLLGVYFQLLCYGGKHMCILSWRNFL